MIELFKTILVFIAEYYVGIIGALNIIMIVCGIAFAIANGIYNTKFVPKDMWDGILVITGVNAIAFAPKLLEFAKYYAKSKYNTDPGIDPEDKKLG